MLITFCSKYIKISLKKLITHWIFVTNIRFASLNKISFFYYFLITTTKRSKKIAYSLRFCTFFHSFYTLFKYLFWNHRFLMNIHSSIFGHANRYEETINAPVRYISSKNAQTYLSVHLCMQVTNWVLNLPKL